ncbi:MAG TPA: hypothetical protein VFG10_15085 [Saprospiraceae bacterium]|nr:hypothetical protein [Saprospiraceae bacterium]
MELHLKIIGTLMIVLALLHFYFPVYFKWKKELSSLSIINRQMMYIHSYFILFLVFLTGILCVTSAHEMVTTTLGRRISLGYGIFWITRLGVQFFGYSSSTWKGKTFETIVHIIFSLLWAYFSAMFILVYLQCT